MKWTSHLLLFTIWNGTLQNSNELFFIRSWTLNSSSIAKKPKYLYRGVGVLSNFIHIVQFRPYGPNVPNFVHIVQLCPFVQFGQYYATLSKTVFTGQILFLLSHFELIAQFCYYCPILSNTVLLRIIYWAEQKITQ